MSDRLTHLDAAGRAVMVDIGDKPVTARRAVAEGFVTVKPSTITAITDGAIPKGDVLAVARVAGIMAAKRCGELIPLCHPLPVESVSVDFEFPPGEPKNIRVVAVATVTAKTGIEMEVLTAVAVAALTIYDMCKAVDKTMTIGGIRLVEKTGGRSTPPLTLPHSLGEE